MVGAEVTPASFIAALKRAFGQRLTPAQHRAIADALWPWWHDADPADAAQDPG